MKENELITYIDEELFDKLADPDYSEKPNKALQDAMKRYSANPPVQW